MLKRLSRAPNSRGRGPARVTGAAACASSSSNLALSTDVPVNVAAAS